MGESLSLALRRAQPRAMGLASAFGGSLEGITDSMHAARRPRHV